jgi:mRNA interferase RelE/StbE
MTFWRMRSSFPLTRYEVLLSQTATKQFQVLPPEFRSKVRSSLRELSKDPFHKRSGSDIKKLKGPNRDHYRLRVGRYRVMYAIENRKIMVTKILPRSKAYEWIE